MVVTINQPRQLSWRSAAEESLATLRTEHEALGREIEQVNGARRENAEALAAADSARERARQRVLQSEERLAALVGDEDDEESLNGLKALRKRIMRRLSRWTNCAK